MYVSTFQSSVGDAYPHAHVSHTAVLPGMRLVVTLSSEVHVHLSVEEAARLHTGLGTALVEAGKVIT